MAKGDLTMSIDYQATIIRIWAELNLSQTELSEVLGVSFTSVNRWENGKYQPTKAIKKELNYYVKNSTLRLKQNNY